LEVANAQQLAVALRELLGSVDERRRMGNIGRYSVESNRGSVERLLELIAPLSTAAPAAARPAASC
jgi:hypothetical protein